MCHRPTGIFLTSTLWTMVKSQIDRMLMRVSDPSLVPRFPGVEEGDAGWSTLAHARLFFLYCAPTAGPGKVMRTSLRGEKKSVILQERRGCALDSRTSRPPRHTMRNICTRVRDSWGRASTSFSVQLNPPIFRDQNVLVLGILLKCKKKTKIQQC